MIKNYSFLFFLKLCYFIKTYVIIEKVLGSDLMAYIEFKNVDKIYQMGEVEIKALNEASFEIEKGELVVILGPSGAGKTTCLNILGGMDSVTSGKVMIENHDITTYSSKELISYRRNDIGFIFQFYNINNF